LSFLYPRTVQISRPNSDNAAGVQPYAGVVETNETVIATGLPASIQATMAGAKNPSGVPAAGAKTNWYVFIPAFACARGTVLQDDVVTDDLGERYQVASNFWDSLGYRLTVEKMQA
jgi:hypothetical protein